MKVQPIYQTAIDGDFCAVDIEALQNPSEAGHYRLLTDFYWLISQGKVQGKIVFAVSKSINSYGDILPGKVIHLLCNSDAKVLKKSRLVESGLCAIRKFRQIWIPLIIHGEISYKFEL